MDAQAKFVCGTRPNDLLVETHVRKPTRREVLLGLSGAAVGIAATGAYQWTSPDRLSLERRTLAPPGWQVDGFRVALLADPHVNTPRDVARMVEAARLAVEEKPDLIVLAGDYVNYEHPRTIEYIQTSLEPLAEFDGPKIAILGNHDYWIPRPREVMDALECHGVRLLRNDPLDIGDVVVAGFDDALTGHARFDFLSARHQGASTLGILHAPDFVSAVPEQINLVLAGHSHGGQVCLPFGIPMKLPYGGRRYVAGYYPKAPRPIYVSRGVGLSGPPYRAFCPPEVSILTIRRT